MTEPEPPRRSQADVYAPMEAAAAEAVAALPDFPGFASRTWHEVPCDHGGEHVRVEIAYMFAEPLWGEPLVRETYADALRGRWEADGLDVHRNEETALASGRVDRNVEALTGDGLNLWYRVSGVVGLVVQSGCVARSAPGEIEYVPPAGGIAPGGPGDLVDAYFPEGVPGGGGGADYSGL
ncbi:hypothetical protein [Glycomyces terrestris]|uniref:Uncharacterized protein n=1 Tax=Glycomyces terrestris TaxID=2493553 RepID=A0A426UWV3_9ACTN|nr:hypothetical protein [Glycomyces terrestris]RRR99089.1 hypothetical protein EIW28_10040 [Glycomyces terrestris]